MAEKLSDEELNKLEALSVAVRSRVWTSQWEGRDQLAGDSFIMSEGSEVTGADRGPDIYISLEGLGPTQEHQDLIAAARTSLPALIAEIRSLRLELQSIATEPPGLR